MEVSNAVDTGLRVIDLDSVPGFAERRLHERDAVTLMEDMLRLFRVFVERPGTILQDLVNAAVSIFGAGSAGISIQEQDESGNTVYHWVATAGMYARFLDAMLPSFPSACGLCLERGKPQWFSVSKRFFELIGVEAEPVTDALLLPWQVDGTNGTIWILAHGSEEAFDSSDARLMSVLAEFAAIAVRQQAQQKQLMQRTTVIAAASMANDLAHSINNPLQGLTNLVFLARQDDVDARSTALATQMSGELERLSSLVTRLLALPLQSSDPIN